MLSLRDGTFRDDVAAAVNVYRSYRASWPRLTFSGMLSRTPFPRSANGPRSHVARPGPLRTPQTVEGDSVADIYPAEAAHPSPAARSNHYEAAEAVAPVAMAPVAVIAATHPTTLTPTTGGSFG